MANNSNTSPETAPERVAPVPLAGKRSDSMKKILSRIMPTADREGLPRLDVAAFNSSI